MKRRSMLRHLARFGLHAVAMVLGLSAFVRLAGGVDEAWVWAGLAGPANAAEGGEAPKMAMVEDPDLAHLNPNGLARLVEVLNRRKSELDAREAMLDRRRQEMVAAEEALQENLRALKLAEERLQATLEQADGALEGDVGHLTQVYESMKPKDASTLFERMDPKFAAGFLARMSPAAASSILAGMTPESAYAISLIFAGRHADVPQN